MVIRKLFSWTEIKYFKTFFHVFAGCLISLTALSQAFPYKFNYITVDEGLSHTDANDITQDKKGYIWIATHFGLNRYDGYSIKKFYNEADPLSNAFKNRVRCLYAAEDGNIWLGTEDGIQKFDPRLVQYSDFKVRGGGKVFAEKIYVPYGDNLYALVGGQLKLFRLNGELLDDQHLSHPKDVRFSDMIPGKNGQLYLSSNKGVWILEKNRIFKRISIEGLTTESLSTLSFDSHRNLLLAGADKLFLAKTANNEQTYAVVYSFSLSGDTGIQSIQTDNNANYWINTGINLYRLDDQLNLIQMINSKSAQHSLNSNALIKIMVDRSQCLWVCSFGGGVNYCDLNAKLFYTLQHNPEVTNSLSGNFVRSILEDGEDLWIGTANGLNLYNFRSKRFRFYNTQSAPLNLKNDVVTALAFDRERNLWIGTAKGIQVLQANRNKWLLPPGHERFPKYVIESLTMDYYGNIWFGNHTDQLGVIWKDATGSYHVQYHGEGYFVHADKKKPELLVSSTQGLKRLIVGPQGQIKKNFLYQASEHKNSLSSNYTYPISMQNDSVYWIGTIGGGLNRLALKPNNAHGIKRYGDDYGVFKDVESLEIDKNGKIWMGGNGLQCFQPESEVLIRYDKNDGLQGNSFKVGASASGLSGRLYFGGINGLNYFFPDEIRTNTLETYPVLTDIFINNGRASQDTVPNNSGNGAIGFDPVLELNYLQNNFVLFFSSMHFANPVKCKYRYKLVGFDKDWHYTDGSNPSAAYSNLDYGSYQFVVEATNNDGIWSKTRAETEIIVTPPWWESKIAKLVYLLLSVSFLAGIYLYQARWHRLKRKMEVQAVKEKKREEMHRQREELYQQQLIFFTNISHEFRTPLTLILGPLEAVIRQNKNKALDYSYHLMFKNAKRLMNLISELMNFKKVADSFIKLQVQPLIINQFCKDIAWEFQTLATSKDIEFELIDHTQTGGPANHTGYFDVQVLEKILFNLLNNSFKYTNRSGRIRFELSFEPFTPSFTTGFRVLNKDYRAKKYMYFRVADNGTGISAESITKIFERYYRITKNHLGSGIGLAMVKSLTQLHKGDIYVYSELYKGTEIIIGIPWGGENYQPSEQALSGMDVETRLEPIDNSILLPTPEEDSLNPSSIPKTSKRILLVEDNDELRTFLKKAFEQYYFVYETADGNEAVEIATKHVPDLIVSDVMMPGMSGIEFCKTVKNKFETSHIPFIILSAKDALDTKIEGMESGADFYFSKPLSIELLLLTVHNIFEQSEKLKSRYTKDYLADATDLVQSEKDKDFFQQLLDLIEDNLQDPELDVSFLCQHLHVSRTKLYQKIKSISDQSVAEFIRTIRLKKAIHLMTSEGISMNEVADRIGMQSSSNFSRAFKKEYGQSPLQFIQSLKKP